MRAGGISGYRIIGMAAPAAVAVMLLDALCGQVIAPRTDPTLADWWRSTTPVADRKVEGPRSFRAGDDLVIAASASADGRAINAVTIYRRDKGPPGRAHRGADRQADRKGWVLNSPVTTRFAGDKAQ
jgi:lipopolysaccharide export system permease protein